MSGSGGIWFCPGIRSGVISTGGCVIGNPVIIIIRIIGRKNLVSVTGDNVSVHYTGTLLNGTKFDSSVDRGQPISIPIGVGQVIKGWDEGIMMLKQGGKAKLIIPPQLGYGSAGAGGVIPPNAWLVFDVKLKKVGN